MKLCKFLKKRTICISIIFSIFLSISIFLSLYYWHYKKNMHLKEVSDHYQNVINTMSTNNTLESITTFIKNNNNIYGILGALEESKKFIDKNQIHNAEITLNKNLKKIKDPSLKCLLVIRLARTQLAQKKIDDAIHTLETINIDEWKAIKFYLLGYAELIKNDVKKAKKIWLEGASHHSASMLKEIIQMQINNLN